MIIIIYIVHVLYDAIIMTGLLHFGKIELINVDHKTPFIVNNMSLGIKEVLNFFHVKYFESYKGINIERNSLVAYNSSMFC